MLMYILFAKLKCQAEYQFHTKVWRKYFVNILLLFKTSDQRTKACTCIVNAKTMMISNLSVFLARTLQSARVLPDIIASLLCARDE